MIPKFWPIVEREWGWIDLYISKTQNILSIWASDLYGHMFYFIYIPKYSVYFVFCCQRFPDDKVWSLSEHNWISVTQKRFLSFAGNRPWKRSHYIYHHERRSKQRLWSLPNVSCRWKARKRLLCQNPPFLALNKQKKKKGCLNCDTGTVFILCCTHTEKCRETKAYSLWNICVFWLSTSWHALDADYILTQTWCIINKNWWKY